MVVGFIAFVLAIPDVALLLRIVSFAVAILGAGFFFPLVCGLVFERVSPAAAIASSVGGVTVTSFWIAATLSGAVWAKAVHAGVPGLAVGGLLLAIVTLVTKPASVAARSKFFEAAR